MMCPCGCGEALIGRQKAASPACRQRLSRAARRIKTEVLAPVTVPIDSPEIAKSVTQEAYPDCPDRWHMPASGAFGLGLLWSTWDDAAAYIDRQLALSNAKRGDWYGLLGSVRKDVVNTDRFTVCMWYGLLRVWVISKQDIGNVLKRDGTRYRVEFGYADDYECGWFPGEDVIRLADLVKHCKSTGQEIPKKVRHGFPWLCE